VFQPIQASHNSCPESSHCRTAVKWPLPRNGGAVGRRGKFLHKSHGTYSNERCGSLTGPGGLGCLCVFGVKELLRANGKWPEAGRSSLAYVFRTSIGYHEEERTRDRMIGQPPRLLLAAWSRLGFCPLARNLSYLRVHGANHHVKGSCLFTALAGCPNFCFSSCRRCRWGDRRRCLLRCFLRQGKC